MLGSLLNVDEGHRLLIFLLYLEIGWKAPTKLTQNVGCHHEKKENKIVC